RSVPAGGAPTSPILPYTTLFRSNTVEGCSTGAALLRRDEGLNRRNLGHWNVMPFPATQQTGANPDSGGTDQHTRSAQPELQDDRSEEHTSELQSRRHRVGRLLPA